MANLLVQQDPTAKKTKSSKMKSSESRNSHSWWSDNHISPENSEWLSENLEEMDQKIKHMLSLIDEDSDSFTNKSEMYSRVEEFYRIYRSLAERYDHATVELRKNISSTSPSPDQRLRRRRSGSRLAGSDVYQKEGDESSASIDSETESDDSSVNNYSCLTGNGDDKGTKRKVMELEIELFRMSGFKEDLRISEAEIARLKIELQKCKSLEFNNDLRDEIASLKLELEENRRSSEKVAQLQNQFELAQKDSATWKAKLNAEKREVSKLQERISRLKSSLSDRDHEIRDLKTAVSDAEQKIFPEKVRIKAEITTLLDEKNRLEEQVREWECRYRNLEEETRKTKREKIELEERLKGEIERLKTDIIHRVGCIENLNKNLKALVSERDDLIAEVSGKTEKMNELEEHLKKLYNEQAELIAGKERAYKVVEELSWRVKELEEETKRQKVEITEGAEEKREAIRQLCFSLEHSRNGYHRLLQAFTGGRKRVPPILAL